MTVKEASVIFKLEEKEIRKRNSDSMILGVGKIGRNIFIPDDTKIIPSKLEIKAFLFQIIKYKNNSAMIMPRNMCPCREHLEVLAEYLYKKGFIGKYKEFSDERGFFDNVKLTDEGINFVFGNLLITKAQNNLSFPIHINQTFSVVNIG